MTAQGACAGRGCAVFPMKKRQWKMTEKEREGRAGLLRRIADFVPLCEQEETDRKILYKALEEEEDILVRENLQAHFSASAWIRNRTGDKVLMLYHNIYRSWSWAGGHADGEADLKQVAMREVREETGLENLKLLKDGIFSLEVLTVDGHEKRGVYIPSHLHYNVTYLFEGDETERLRIRPDENSAVSWIERERLKEEVAEAWMMERIYAKLLSRM